MAAGYDLAGGHDGNYYVGGHAQLTTISADGVKATPSDLRWGKAKTRDPDDQETGTGIVDLIERYDDGGLKRKRT